LQTEVDLLIGSAKLSKNTLHALATTEGFHLVSTTTIVLHNIANRQLKRIKIQLLIGLYIRRVGPCALLLSEASIWFQIWGQWGVTDPGLKTWGSCVLKAQQMEATPHDRGNHPWNIYLIISLHKSFY